MEIKEKIISILSIHSDMENVDQCLHENDDLTALNMNSISIIKIIVGLEGEFNFEFEDEYLDFKKFVSLDLLCSYVEEKIKSCSNI